MDPYREFSIGVFPNCPLPCLEAGQDVEAKLWFDGPGVLPPPLSGFGALGLNLGSLQEPTSLADPPPPAAGWCHGQRAGSRWEPLGENTAGKGSGYTIVTLQPGLKSRNINN